jgi:ribosome biogenesis protein ENP2
LFGRDLAYNKENCDMYVAAAGDEVYRLNLETGSFKEPFTLGYKGCNKVAINSVHRILACGGESACCEFWETRSRKSITKLFITDNSSNNRDLEVSAIKFDSDGLTLALGTSQGNCMLYDIRSSRPLYTKEHQYDLPIIDVTFHNEGNSKHVLSTDKKIMKIWKRDGGDMGGILTNIETPSDINAVQVVSDKRGMSGLILMAGEQSRVMTYFVPSLGPAPRWCSYLEGITEELEESAQQSVYEDYKFITQQEVDELGASGLIGTPMLRSYMHGYFIDMKLYSKLRAVSKPFEYEEHRKRKIREKIEENRKSRIIAQKRLPKVNKDLAVKLDKRGGGEGAAGVDDRFAALFVREEFEQDPESLEFQLRNPVRGQAIKRGGDDSDDELNGEDADAGSEAASVVEEEDEDFSEVDDDDDEEAQDEDDDVEKLYSNKKRKNDRGGRVEREEEGDIMKSTKRQIERQERGASSSERRPAPKMFGISQTTNFKKVAFSQKENKSQSKTAIPLNTRSDNDSLDHELRFNLRVYRLSELGDTSSKATGRVRHFNAGKQGTVRELSFIPKSGGGNDRGKSPFSGRRPF